MSQPPPPPGMEAPPAPAPPSAGGTSAAGPAAPEQPPPPPPPPVTSDVGKYEQLHEEAKRLFPMPFGGVKFDFMRGTAEHMQVTHGFNFGSSGGQEPAGYSFQPLFCGSHQTNPPNAPHGWPVIQASMNHEGMLQGFGKFCFTPQVSVDGRMGIAPGNEWQNWSYNAAYEGKDFTANCQIHNPEIGTGRYLAQPSYMQKMSNELALGAQMNYGLMSQDGTSEQRIADVAFGGRYKTKDWVFSGTLVSLQAPGLDLSYAHTLSKEVSVATELELMLGHEIYRATVGFSKSFPTGSMVQASTRTDGKSTFSWLQAIPTTVGLPMGVRLTGVYNLLKNTAVFGLGVEMQM